MEGGVDIEVGTGVVCRTRWTSKDFHGQETVETGTCDTGDGII